jgi:hypothetical protein
VSVYYSKYKQPITKEQTMSDISKIRIQGVEYSIKDLVSRANDASLEDRVEALESAEAVLDEALKQVEL